LIEAIKVGIAELKTAASPAKIITTGLGSCVGVCIWDPGSKIGGMVHVMLPDSTAGRYVQNPAKFADTGVALLIEEIIRLGASRTRLAAKIAGGAQMFSFPGQSSIMKIGERNTEMVKKALELGKVKLLAEDTGGNYGRTIEFFTHNGDLVIRTINKGQKTI
jgi:chemotaxis protein CheD